MFFSKGKKIKEQIDKHLISVTECSEKFEEFIEKVLEKKDLETLREINSEIDNLESKADNDRHSIIKTLLYEGVLLADTREEILKVIEYVDDIANKKERIAEEILVINFKFDDSIKGKIKEILKMEKKQYKLAMQIVRNLFNEEKSFDQNYKDIREIERLEGQIDDVEWDIITNIYELDIPLGQKMEMKNIIKAIAEVSDTIEKISDVLEIILATRRV